MKRIITIISLTILLFIGEIVCAEQIQINTAQRAIITEFNSLIEKDRIDDGIDGSVSFVIFSGDKLLLTQAYGPANKNSLSGAKTTYRIGSITKSFTGFLLLVMQQNGQLDLDEPIEKYLPEVKQLINYANYQPITFRQLASHTSGVQRESQYGEANMGSVDKWESLVLNSISKTTINSTPGSRFRYSNIGYAILGLAISRAGKLPYIELVENLILKPLKMNDTFFVVPQQKIPNLARGMAGGPTAELNYNLPLQEHQGRGYRIPNGGLYSNAVDLAKFAAASMGYFDILTITNTHQLRKSQTPTKRLRSNYGIGFQLNEYEKLSTVGHGGSTPGYSAHLEYDEDSEFGIVILRNYNFGNTNLDLRSYALLKKLKSAMQ
jgi:CubicO group peptidase (beta-lactamase class C family)